MSVSTARFYGCLADFLPAPRRGRDLRLEFSGTPSVKDTLEAAGVPHTEIDLILVDGRSAGFDRLLHGGERIAAYPAFTRIDVRPLHPLLPVPPAEFRFVLDVHLGRLARYLRLAGFDSLYDNAYADREIVELSTRDDRTVLTRDVGLLKHAALRRGHWLRATAPRAQFAEVVRRFDLRGRFTPFTRCMICNGRLEDLAADAARGRVPRRVAASFDRFRLCGVCRRVYWRGSHYERLLRLLEDVAEERHE